MSLKALIIDDDVNIRNLLNRFLQRKGIETVLAEDGLEGVAVAKKIHPDLIMLDVVMPRMDGLTAGRLIKSYRPLSRVPMIFLTAACNDRDVSLGLRTHAEAYITKPFDVQELSRVIDEMLGFPVYS